jgi:7-cyano-7-deazaguanine synthase in queuosine biosynthesis
MTFNRAQRLLEDDAAFMVAARRSVDDDESRYAMAEPTRIEVVAWSGGADSTMLLLERAREASPEVPVIALTLSDHSHVPRVQMASQVAAQKRFLKWAKRRWEVHIRHVSVSVEATAEYHLAKGVTQSMLWVSHLAPYLPARCRLSFGYIKPDIHWHWRHRADAALLSLAKLAKANWIIEYPYEWTDKGQILNSLREWKVPIDCWWTCEGPRRVGVVCGICPKCMALWIEKPKKAK